ncbi:conserved hypothetical protein [Verrucomicrobia bacterium]|nr:conserved hypothetical protein [Verrucomicrobiota bacterium]
MNQSYACPNCGAAVTFQSSIAVFAVCPFCRSMVVRHDVNVEAIGQMAQLPPDLSPLQLGTQGEIDGQGFTLIGRVRLAYEEGSWNEWCALFADERYGWVAEAQGFFMVSFEIAPPEGFPQGADGMPLGTKWNIEEQSYDVTDSKETVVLGSEGELPFAAPPNRKATSIDLTGAGGKFASVEFSEAGCRLFVGRYARFDDLKFSNLRPVPGWSEGESAPKGQEATSLQCPSCGAPVVLRALGFTMSAACGSCASIIDTATPDLSLIRRAQEKQRLQPRIPLGRRGVLFGVNYEVIGFQHVKDNFSGWFEYLLFNPWQGFVWLVNYNGHWSFVRRLYEQPEVKEGAFSASAAHARFKGETYRMFAAGAVSTDYVVGEFYWKVAVGMKTNVADFVNPPWILSRETYPDLAEETWSQGEYVEPDVLEKAFNLEAPLPEPVGVYLNQPNRYAEKGQQLKWLVPFLLAALLVVQMVSARRTAHQPVLTGSYKYRAGVTNPIVVTEPFEVKGGKQALEYNLFAPVNNNWLELDIDLVNADTHQVAASRDQSIEYYQGYDDGPWSEGRQSQHVLIPAVAPGSYYLTIDASADVSVRELPFTVTIVRDVVVWSNFWIALALLLAYPLYCWVRASAFERARWLESDYTTGD